MYIERKRANIFVICIDSGHGGGKIISSASGSIVMLYGFLKYGEGKGMRMVSKQNKTEGPKEREKEKDKTNINT